MLIASKSWLSFVRNNYKYNENIVTEYSFILK